MNRKQALFEEAKQYLVAGASAGQRFNGAMGYPLYLDHADGSRLYDIDGKEYLDFHGGSGAAMFGHNHPRIRAEAQRAHEL